MGTGVHVVRICLRSAAVHRGHSVSGARTDPHATGTVASRTGNESTTGAPVAPSP